MYLKQVKGLGLWTAFQTNERVGKLIRQILALVYLPSEHIEHTVVHIEAQCSDVTFRELTTYIRSQWLGAWPPETWSGFMIFTRTNNDVEGWHHRLTNR